MSTDNPDLETSGAVPGAPEEEPASASGGEEGAAAPGAENGGAGEEGAAGQPGGEPEEGAVATAEETPARTLVCALCDEVIEGDDEYIRTSYGLVHSPGCSSNAGGRVS